MKGLILAAGRGSRMGTLTEALPKCLVHLRGRPLLEWQVEALHGGGVDQIGIVRGYRGEVFAGLPYALFDNPGWADSNMVASLLCAKAWLRQDACIVSYADIFYPPQTVRALVESAGNIVVAFDPDWETLWRRRMEDPLADAETFRHDGDGRLLEIGARAADIADIQGQYMGLFKLTPAGFAAIEDHLAGLPAPQLARLDMTGLLARLLADGVRIDTVPSVGIWGEVDTASDLAAYESMLAPDAGAGAGHES